MIARAFAAQVIVSLLVGVCTAQDATPAPAITHGPFVGHQDADSLILYGRASAPGTYVLRLLRPDGTELAGVAAAATAAGDHTLHWRVNGLRDERGPFGLRIHKGSELVVAREIVYLMPGISDDRSNTRIAFGSCAEERRFDEQPVWDSIVAREPHALVLLGDTPYIDSTKLDVQRARYAEFTAFEPVRRCLSLVPTYATWDDHDYAINDHFGIVPGRENSRRAFIENHGLPSYGEHDQGIYTSFRRGPIEVFLLDARWFADTEDSPLAPSHRSLLGAQQIAWLQRGLRASTAAFKVLACGMVWNGATRPDKKDCWGNWPDERDALFAWLGTEHVSGVAVVGGDLHVTRLILHPTTELCGYAIPEFITSPLAQNVIPANAGEIDGVLFDAAIPETFLLLDAQITDAEALLIARFCDGDGKELFARAFPMGELR